MVKSRARTLLNTVLCISVYAIYQSTSKTRDCNNTYMQNSLSSNEKQPTRVFASSKTVILLWTGLYDWEEDFILNSIRLGTTWSPFFAQSQPVCCTDPDILVTTNRSLLATATAIVFFQCNLNIADMPLFRYPGQVWVLYFVESPGLPMWDVELLKYSHLFHWTMSYRRDSDIWSPYGYKVPLEKPLGKNETIMMPGGIPLSDWIAGKTKTISAAISHCQVASQRDRLLPSLVHSPLAIDVYGTCYKNITGEMGPELCPRLRCNETEIWRTMATQYKFFFAAENSLCEDYVTEKLWRTLQEGMVPLVYGGVNYTAVAPPNSFIDVSQFKSVSELVNYINWVSQHPEEYSKYFEWRREFGIELTDCWAGWCALCNRAKQYHDNSYSVIVNAYDESLHRWWNQKKIGNATKSACSKPPSWVAKLKPPEILKNNVESTTKSIS